MRKFFPALAALAVLAAGGAVLAQEQSQAEALPQGPKISFPVEELGGCASRQECKTYCDDATHTQACISFAEKNGMMSKDEAQTARKFSAQTGPGGCRGSQCRTYCGEKAHFDECRKFAEEHGMAPKRPEPAVREGPQVDESKAETILAQKDGPGGCKTKDECKAYCNESSHGDECVKFAEENGLMSKDDAAVARKMMTATGPGGCKGIECKTYCEDDAHMEECVAFAEKSGLMDREELQRAKSFMQKGGPGGCKGRAACEEYCSDPAHQDTCMQYAVDNGMMSAEDAAQARQMMQDGGERGPGAREDRQGFFGGPDEQRVERSGPGGCTSREECDAFCRSNPEECHPEEGEGGDGVGQERAMERRGFDVPPGLLKDCMENPETCLERAGGMQRPDPEMFKNMSEEERQRFMQEGRGPREGDFPGMTAPQQYPPEGRQMPPGPGQFQEQYQQEFNRESQGEYQEQYQQQPPDGAQPPPDAFQSPPSDYRPPEGSAPPPEGEMMQPPPPPPSGDAPQSNASASFVAAVYSILAQLLGR